MGTEQQRSFESPQERVGGLGVGGVGASGCSWCLWTPGFPPRGEAGVRASSGLGRGGAGRGAAGML